MRACLILFAFFVTATLSTPTRAQHAYTNFLPTTEDTAATTSLPSEPSTSPSQATQTSPTKPTSPSTSHKPLVAIATCTDVNNRTFNSDENGYAYCLTSQSHVPTPPPRQVDLPKTPNPKASGTVLFNIGH